MQTDSDLIRALLVEMRKYIICHGLLMGECAAWNRLKELYGVGEDQEADEAWLQEYQQRKAISIKHRNNRGRSECGGEGSYR